MTVPVNGEGVVILREESNRMPRPENSSRSRSKARADQGEGCITMMTIIPCRRGHKFPSCPNCAPPPLRVHQQEDASSGGSSRGSASSSTSTCSRTLVALPILNQRPRILHWTCSTSPQGACPMTTVTATANALGRQPEEALL